MRYACLAVLLLVGCGPAEKDPTTPAPQPQQPVPDAGPPRMRTVFPTSDLFEAKLMEVQTPPQRVGFDVRAIAPGMPANAEKVRLQLTGYLTGKWPNPVRLWFTPPGMQQLEEPVTIQATRSGVNQARDIWVAAGPTLTVSAYSTSDTLYGATMTIVRVLAWTEPE